ncbi:ThuA domain-containing protein [Microbacterium sp. SS28]|uniref:ThuA domain-containing protein n=1 Tax=Microbacterium sp. SS28 TaxID=2919948 RepID=UPI001FA9BDAC|nr:ThuA domain-containing protein [Microbacterium sp. SS28]
MRAVIASGTGRYADPWHPFPKTSPLVAEILRDAGFEVAVDPDVDHAVAHLDDVDLLVVNAGDPWRDHDETGATPAPDALAAALERGIGVIALHCAVASLRDYPEWAPAIGAMWVPGLSYHPTAGVISVAVGGLPGQPHSSFEVHDESYCRLQRLGRSTVVAEHPGDGSPEPAAWIREAGASRVAVDVLGHDERSYESAGHRELLRRLALWAVQASTRP